MDDPPTVCELCGHVCPTVGDLTRHLERSHGVDRADQHAEELQNHRDLVSAIRLLEAETGAYLRDRRRDGASAREAYEARMRHRDASVRVWRVAARGITHLVPAVFLQRVIWRVGNAEKYADRRNTDVPHPLARPGAVLMAAKIDVTPEDALVMTRGKPALTELVLQAEEVRLE